MDESGNPQRTIAGTAGIFLGMWYVTDRTTKRGLC